MDASDYKIEVFTKINDQSREPTITRAGNGSHIISKFNSFVDGVSQELDTITDNTNRFSNSIESLGDNIAAFEQKIQSGLIKRPSIGGFGNHALIDDSTSNISVYLTQNSGIRIPLLNHNYFCARCSLWLDFQNQLFPIDLMLSSKVSPKAIVYDWYFPSREGYPGEIYDNFDIFGYTNLEIGAGADLEQIDTTKPGLHFSLVTNMFNEYLLDIYSNYPQRLQFTAEIKSFYLYT